MHGDEIVEFQKWEKRDGGPWRSILHPPPPNSPSPASRGLFMLLRIWRKPIYYSFTQRKSLRSFCVLTFVKFCNVFFFSLSFHPFFAERNSVGRYSRTLMFSDLRHGRFLQHCSVSETSVLAAHIEMHVST